MKKLQQIINDLKAEREKTEKQIPKKRIGTMDYRDLCKKRSVFSQCIEQLESLLPKAETEGGDKVAGEDSGLWL